MLKHERPRAKMLYSYYCTRAPQTRYFDYEHVKKQMYKVHSPHLKSGYLAKVEIQEKRSASGEPDWIMLYTPGRRAKAEFREATKPRAIQRLKRIHMLPSAVTEPEQPPVQIGCDTESLELDPLVTKLMSFHVAEATARELVRDYRKAVELQLRALPHRNTNKIKDPASWLVTAIKENYQLPEPIVTALEKEEEVKHAIAKKEAEVARQQRREVLQPAYYDYLRREQGSCQKSSQKPTGPF